MERGVGCALSLGLRAIASAVSKGALKQIWRVNGHGKTSAS